MQSLKEWNMKPAGDQSLPNFKIFVRTQHCELKKFGGLTIQNSSLHMMQEIKNHQEAISHNLKLEIRDGIMETLQAFNLSSNNKENINPNSETPIATNHGFGCPTGYNYPVNSRYL